MDRYPRIWGAKTDPVIRSNAQDSRGTLVDLPQRITYWISLQYAFSKQG
jgi:hypothetical protein